jgi:hypothetical protein
MMSKEESVGKRWDRIFHMNMESVSPLFRITYDYSHRNLFTNHHKKGAINREGK